MTVGAPGAGIGGLFYLASALMLPARSVYRVIRGEPVAWGPMARQWLLAVAVLGAIWGAGWLIGLWTGPVLLPPVGGRGMAATIIRSTGVLANAMLYASVATLVLVLLLVKLGSLLVERRPVTPADRRRGAP